MDKIVTVNGEVIEGSGCDEGVGIEQKRMTFGFESHEVTVTVSKADAERLETAFGANMIGGVNDE